MAFIFNSPAIASIGKRAGILRVQSVMCPKVSVANSGVKLESYCENCREDCDIL